MSVSNIHDAGSHHVEHVQMVSRDLIEKAMEMRCVSYLAQVKANLLLETIFEVDKSRKLVRKINQSLERRVEEKTKGLRESNRALQSEVKEHMHTEQQLDKLAQAVQYAGEGIIITDSTGKIEYVNQAFCTMLGYEESEVLGSTPALLKSGQQNNYFYDNLWSTITSGQVWSDTIIDRKKDGSLISLMMTIAPIFDHDGAITSYVAMQQDMTKQKELEEQFQQAQKMDALGTLVGGIAHDFNNMLAAITGNIYLAKKDCQSSPASLRTYLDSVETLAFNASGIVKQLLAFARKSTVSKASLSLNILMEEALKLQEVNVPENIRFEHTFCQCDLMVDADATQLQQVLVNLVNNAKDAVEGRTSPCIQLCLEPFYANDDFLNKHKTIEGRNFAKLSVRDNGCGIAQLDLEKVFDPFFTTKEVGKGTGLGLAMVFGAVRSHQGLLEVTSNVDKGTSFHVYLPLLSFSDILPSDVPVTETVMGKGESILLVDDNERVLSASQHVLESLGYHVLTAVNGVDAVKLYISNNDKVDLIIFDLVMPEMSGGDAAKEIIAIFPNVKIIFATAYDSRGELAKDMAMSHVLLEKPFAVPLLSQAIRAELDG